MPGNMKVTVFFQDGDFGWTETYYPRVALGDYVAADTWAQGLMPLRQALMAAGTGGWPAIQGYRVSDDTIFRDALINLFQPMLVGSATGPPAACFTALLLRLVAGPLWRRPLYLRGVPTSIVGDDMTYVGGPAFKGLLAPYKAYLTGSQGAFVKTTVADPPGTIYRLQAVAPPNSFTTLIPHGFGSGDIVVVKGSSRHRNPTGVWKVSAVAGPTQFSLSGVDLPADYVYYPPLSLGVQIKIPIYKAITTVIDERITERKTGRPFGGPRGRRSPRRV